MRFAAACAVGVAALLAGAAWAQPGQRWDRIPSVVVIGVASDPRVPLVDEAVDFWNRTFAEIGSAMRIGTVTRIEQAVPGDALQMLSNSMVGARPGPVFIPPALRNLPGDITIVLSDSDLVSFAGPFDEHRKRVVAIRGNAFAPINQPNVARNVIAHELGHVLGLGHNSDPATLMCGRPAPCRPGVFRSQEPKFFPLTDEEKRLLLALYPADWKPR
jgi:hypothetical protein